MPDNQEMTKDTPNCDQASCKEELMTGIFALLAQEEERVSQKKTNEAEKNK